MYKERLDDFFEDNRKEFVEAIFQLVKIPSVKAEPAAGMPFGEEVNNSLEKSMEIAEKLGFKTKNYDGYVGTIDFSSDETALDILAHLDIVPVNPADWTVCPPFEPVERDGKIYGRGTSDDKGPAIACLYAMKAIRDLNIPLKKNVRLILGTDEESGSEDIKYYYSAVKPAPNTFSPDANFPVINVEKGRLSAEIIANYKPDTNLAHIISAKAGSVANVIPDYAIAKIKGLPVEQIIPVVEQWQEKTSQHGTITEDGDGIITVEVKAVAGHAAYPQKANNAVTGLLELLSALPLGDSDHFRAVKAISKLFPHGDWAGKSAGIAREDEISEELTISLNIIDFTENGLKAIFDSRTPVSSNNANTLDVLTKNAENLGLELNTLNISLPHHVPADSPFITTLLDAYEKYSGKKGETRVTGGGTYVHGLENGVAFGPATEGTDYRMHGANEFAIVDELLTAAKIYTQVIIDICS